MKECIEKSGFPASYWSTVYHLCRDIKVFTELQLSSWILCVCKWIFIHPHIQYTRTQTHKPVPNTHYEYKQGLLVFLSLACMKAITGHLEHGPLGEQQVGPCGLNELLSVTSLPPTWPTSVSTLVSLPPTSQPSTPVQLLPPTGCYWLVFHRKSCLLSVMFQFGVKLFHEGKKLCLSQINWCQKLKDDPTHMHPTNSSGP